MTAERVGATGAGVAISLGASGMFGLVFYLSGQASGSSASDIFGFRVLGILAWYSFLLVKPGTRRAVMNLARDLLTHPRKLCTLVVTSFLVGVQLWAFSWAPSSGHALDAALGFLLMPIVLVLAGRFIFRDVVRPLQWAAVFLAASAVLVSLVIDGGLSWLTFLICFGYPLYFVLRRRAILDGPVVFGFEMIFVAPAVITIFVISGVPLDTNLQLGPLTAIGLSGAVAMALYLRSAQLLPLPLFGLLGYVEPVLLIIVAWLLGETPQIQDLGTYVLLLSALLLVALNGVLDARRLELPSH